MTLYNVHIYREMRLFFPGIEAASPEEAARIAASKPTCEAEYTVDCDGEDPSALIDVVGDDEFEHSVAIDFEAERMRKAAPELQEALAELLRCYQQFVPQGDLENAPEEWQEVFQARAALAKATLTHQLTTERNHSMTRTETAHAITRHTPGPWDYDMDYIVAPDPGSRYPDIYIAEIAHSDDEGRIASPQQQDANRRLIAAAPELLAALTLWVSGADLDEFDQAARIAIAAATAEHCDWR